MCALVGVLRRMFFGVQFIIYNAVRCRAMRRGAIMLCSYGAASEEDLLNGKWYDIGANPDFRQCECPSFYPLPAATPGFEAEYVVALSCACTRLRVLV